MSRDIIGLGRTGTPPTKETRLLQEAYTAFSQRKLSPLISKLAELEKLPSLSKDVLADSYLLVCDLALQLDKYNLGFEYTLKIIQLGSQKMAEKKALSLLHELAKTIDERKPEVQADWKKQLEKFIVHYLTPGRIDQASLEVNRDWMIILSYILPDSHFKLQLSLTEKVLAQTIDSHDFAAIFITYVSLAQKMLVRYPNEIERQRICLAAERAIERAPGYFAGLNLDLFHSLIADLEELGLFDLLTRMLELRKPAPDDPIWQFHRLAAAFRQDLDRAFWITQNDLPLIAEPDRTIYHAISKLSIAIVHKYLEQNKKNIDSIKLPPEEENWRSKVLLRPRGEFPDLLRLAREGQQRYLRIFDQMIGSRFCYLPVTFKPFLGIGGKTNFLIYTPEASAIEIYLHDKKDGKYFKLKYPIIKNRAAPAFSLEPYFEGCRKDAAANASLIWEILAMTVLSYGAQQGKEKAEIDINAFLIKIDEAVRKAGISLFLKENAAHADRLKAAFDAVEPERITLLDLDNRGELCRKMIDRFIPEIKGGLYTLDPSDPLYPLVDQIEIISFSPYGESLTKVLELQPPELETLLGKEEGKFPVGLVYKMRSGEIFFSLLKAPDKIEIFGSKLDSRTAFFRNLEGLALETIIKLWDAKERRRSPAAADRSSYLVAFEKEDELHSVDHKNGIPLLMEIYKIAFYALIRKKGISIAPWFYLKDGFYHPLADQTPEGKKLAREQFGTENIFIGVEPNGVPSRLPVRLKWVNGEKKLAPFERDPAREKQQALLNDTQPLKSYFGLYVISELSDKTEHVMLYALRESEEELYGPLYQEIDQAVGRGDFKDPEIITRDMRENRKALIAKLRSGELTVVHQGFDIFPIQQTFRRPKMVSLSALLAEGIPLEGIE